MSQPDESEGTSYVRTDDPFQALMGITLVTKVLTSPNAANYFRFLVERYETEVARRRAEYVAAISTWESEGGSIVTYPNVGY